MKENLITQEGFGRFTKPEIDIIKRTFKDNETLLKLIKKIFVPEPDPEAPIGQTINIYNSIDPNQNDPYAVLAEVKARNLLIGHLTVQVQLLKNICDMREETDKEREQRLRKDSNK